MKTANTNTIKKLNAIVEAVSWDYENFLEKVEADNGEAEYFATDWKTYPYPQLIDKNYPVEFRFVHMRDYEASLVDVWHVLQFRLVAPQMYSVTSDITAKGAYASTRSKVVLRTFTLPQLFEAELDSLLNELEKEWDALNHDMQYFTLDNMVGWELYTATVSYVDDIAYDFNINDTALSLLLNRWGYRYASWHFAKAEDGTTLVIFGNGKPYRDPTYKEVMVPYKQFMNCEWNYWLSQAYVGIYACPTLVKILNINPA